MGNATSSSGAEEEEEVGVGSAAPSQNERKPSLASLGLSGRRRDSESSSKAAGTNKVSAPAAEESRGGDGGSGKNEESGDLRDTKKDKKKKKSKKHKKKKDKERDKEKEGEEDGEKKEKKKKHRHHHHHHHHHRHSSSPHRKHSKPRHRSSATDVESETPPISAPTSPSRTMDKFQLILESLPYFGQGDDAGTDQVVRQVLQSAQVGDLEGRDEYGNTILILAVQYGAVDLVPIIMGKRAVDVNAVNSAGACALHFACYKDTFDLSVATALLAAGSQPEVVENTYGCTPLHYAASTGSVELCRALIDAGAKATTTDFLQYTASDYARQSGNSDCLALFERLLANAEGGGKAESSAPSRHGSISSGSVRRSSAGRSSFRSFWSRHHDPSTGLAYHLNEDTGESIWEKDLQQRAKDLHSSSGAADEVTASVQDWLVQQTHRARLIALLGRHAPLQLMSVDNMLRENVGSEEKLLKRLAGELGVTEDEDSAALAEEAKNGFRERRSVTGGDQNNRPLTAVASTSQIVSQLNQQLSVLDGRMREEHTARLLEDEKARHAQAMEGDRILHADAVAALEGELVELLAQGQAAAEESARAASDADRLGKSVSAMREQVSSETSKQLADVESLRVSVSRLEEELFAQREEVEKLTSQLEEKQSGAAAAAAQAAAIAEAKAAEVAQVSKHWRDEVASARSLAASEEAAFSREQALQRKEVEGGPRQELLRLQKELTAAKARAAASLSRASSEAEAARAAADRAHSKRMAAEEEAASCRSVLAESSAILSRNTALQMYVARETERRKQLHNEMEDLKGKIRVYVRVRPMSTKEEARGCTAAVRAEGRQGVIVSDPKSKTDRNWDFDRVWAGTEEQGNNQVDIFKDTGYLVTSAVDGYNVCVFAYGQTGSGKTYTMFGAGGIGGGLNKETGECDSGSGVTPRAVAELFRVLKERETQFSYSVNVTMFELYRDGLRDLFCRRKDAPKLSIKLAEHSSTGLVVVEGAVEVEANSIAELVDAIVAGAERRAVSSTQMNSDSSRSHLICSIVISSTNRRTGRVVRGKLTLVDLAGSERVGKSGASGDQLKEAQSINKSLSALGDVIGALTSGNNFIPYRNHPLTMCMSDSLGGNSLMFVCASPADYNTAETINSLQFSTRCKDVTNSVIGGPAAQAAQLQALRRELEKAKAVAGPGPRKPAQLSRPT